MSKEERLNDRSMLLGRTYSEFLRNLPHDPAFPAVEQEQDVKSQFQRKRKRMEGRREGRGLTFDAGGGKTREPSAQALSYWRETKG